MANGTDNGNFRLAARITGLNVLVASGFAIAGLVIPHSILPPGSAVTEAAEIFALYAAARTLPLAAIVLIAIYKRSVQALIVLGILAGVIQWMDAGVGFFQKDAGKIIGPLILGALQFYAVSRLKRSAINR